MRDRQKWGKVHHHYMLLAFISFLPVPVEAQLIPDNTLGKENSLVNSVDSVTSQINGGAIRGSNLFHSFQEFNIGKGESVSFSNPSAIQNILTRVTGTNSSQIFGKLGILGDANLFLINPNGIVFGKNAKLDIGGSFIGSTADSIKLNGGREFSAVNPSTNPILTISVPLGLQYGANPGNIEVHGGLQVEDGESLALIGGNIKLDGGNLTASAGEIDLFAAKNGEVSLVNSNGQINLQVGESTGYGDIELLNTAKVDTNGNSGGSIEVRGRNIILKDKSEIWTNTEGNGSGETLNIAATELLKISQSALFANVQKGATGTGGNLIIETTNLQVDNGSAINVRTYGSGNAGNLSIKTTNLQVDNGSAINVRTYGSGNAGNLSIKTTNLQVYNGGQISAATNGKGTAGNMEVKADLVELVGFRKTGNTPAKSGLFTSAVQEDGQGGNLNVIANRLIIRDGATINASNFFSFDPENNRGLAGTGGAGNININSRFILLENQGIITANANAGDKGNINIQSQNLQLRQESAISTNAKNSANGGNINIGTDTLLALENSDITANSEGSFGGRVIINAQGILGSQFQQQLTPKSDITATSSLGASFSGVVDINTIAVDPSSGLVELPSTLVGTTGIKAGCGASAGNNFIVKGRGGLPQNPDDLFSGNSIHTELFDLISTPNLNKNINSEYSSLNVNHQKNKIVEATGFIFDAEGNVMLVANFPADNSQYSVSASVNCQDFSTVN